MLNNIPGKFENCICGHGTRLQLAAVFSPGCPGRFQSRAVSTGLFQSFSSLFAAQACFHPRLLPAQSLSLSQGEFIFQIVPCSGDFHPRACSNARCPCCAAPHPPLFQIRTRTRSNKSSLTITLPLTPPTTTATTTTTTATTAATTTTIDFYNYYLKGFQKGFEDLKTSRA